MQIVKKYFVKIALPPANTDHAEIIYRFELVAIYPAIYKIKEAILLDGYTLPSLGKWYKTETRHSFH